MDLRELFSLIRGESLSFMARVEDIPCIEMSDAEKLCRNPLVSVHMITYNHEPYIRQAIEGVLKQQTDFEYELVIGEDASQDKTREICFEYQKKYPEKIRVLWSERNVFGLGGNGTRVSSRCRGTYIAFCEGDDYWTDPHKLEKQVAAFRAHPTVGICIAGARILNQATGVFSEYGIKSFPEGFLNGKDFFRIHCFGGDPADFIMTATVMMKRSVLETIKRMYEIFKWKFYIGDTIAWLGASTVSDAFVSYDSVAVYRRTNTGAMAVNGAKTGTDGDLAKLYYGVKYLNAPIGDVMDRLSDTFAIDIFHLAKTLPCIRQRERACHLLKTKLTRRIFRNPLTWPGLCLMRGGLLNGLSARIAGQVVCHLGKWHRNRVVRWFDKRYF